MNNKKHTVTVPLGNRSYPIYTGSSFLETAGAYFVRHHCARTAVIITDENAGRRYLGMLQKSLRARGITVHAIVLPSGEGQKSLRTAERIYTFLISQGIERSSTIVALGGGVIGDLSGFIAATYQRGVGFVQIPTTLLSQVDSSVGGKVGINHPQAKNMIGAFYQPKFVLADAGTLATLPKREFISGLGEVIKYGMILDPKVFQTVERSLDKILSRNPAIMTALIRRSCELKSLVVSRDEHEEHLRAILNFGHTVGHALEHAGKYGALKHGEAVMYGMVAETHIAFELGMISSTEKDRLEQLIRRLPVPSLSAITLSPAALIRTMKKDKKTKDGAIRMCLPSKIGSVSLPVNVSESSVLRAIEYVKEYGQ